MTYITLLSATARELGMVAIWTSCNDTKLLCLQRFVRMFAYGSSTLILTLYLSELGFSDERIGLFMSMTLWGDMIISLFLTVCADGLGRRKVLAVGSLMMAMSGIIFVLSGNYWILLAGAIFGVISPSGNEIGPFRAIEESTISQLSTKEVRSDVIAWYTLLGTLGLALGFLSGGWLLKYLQHTLDWEVVPAYRALFVVYAFIGIIKLSLSVALSKKVEVDEEQYHGESNALSKGKTKKRGLLPDISRETQLLMLALCALFCVDSLASGMVASSWIVPFFKRKFDMGDGPLGTLFFISNILSAISVLGASSLARRIGLIKTMSFTHMPSAIFLGLIPFPAHETLAATFLFLRACTASMDTAPRSAFLSAVVRPTERTAVMGIVNLVKTGAQSVGPSVTGWLFSRNVAWVAFVVAAALKISYDVGMLAMFVGHVSHEDKMAARADGARDESSADEGVMLDTRDEGTVLEDDLDATTERTDFLERER